MNYKNIIDIIETICDNHYFINEFGYGDISDISTPDDDKAPDYPYVFVNPVNVAMGDKTTTFNFNLICMTQAYDTQTDTIQQQSNCMVYVKDIISSVNMTLDNPLIEFVEPYNITPFKERFSDDVVGATANITIEFANVLDNCFTTEITLLIVLVYIKKSAISLKLEPDNFTLLVRISGNDETAAPEIIILS